MDERSTLEENWSLFWLAEYVYVRHSYIIVTDNHLERILEKKN